uniref:NADH-ubiquinone oxidoreductase chain 6 n=1 Tax=Boulengerella maculata TaxID=42603 RepID=F7IWP6_9TELE|nr:NADH dehydrogenase subunit 6 [Boulengerella maculata]
MNYLYFLFLLGVVVGLVGVASNPSPYFAALGLVLAAGAACGVLVMCGGSFLSLVLFLIYLGGMLVVFAYSAALAAEPFPASWGDFSVLGYVLAYLLGTGVAAWWLGEGWGKEYGVVSSEGFAVFCSDMSGVALMYSSGGCMLIICGWALLVALLAVLELTRGLGRGAIRAV